MPLSMPEAQGIAVLRELDTDGVTQTPLLAPPTTVLSFFKHTGTKRQDHAAVSVSLEP